MATIINTSPAGSAQSDSGSVMGMIVGLFLVIVLAVLLYAYGLPLLRGSMRGTNVESVQMNVPDKIDVNVNQSK